MLKRAEKFLSESNISACKGLKNHCCNKIGISAIVLFNLHSIFQNYDIFQGSVCCGYGSKGTASSGYDCVMIPGAVGKVPFANSICGQGKGLVTASGISTTICSKEH